MQNTSAAPRSRIDRNVWAGLIFIVIAIAFGWEASHYEMGRAIRMGPGFIPVTLALILAALGALVLLEGFRRPAEGAADDGPVPWKGIALVCVALVVFGRFAALLGLVPVVFVCTFLVAMASARNSAASAGLIAVLMAALCWLVFKIGLGIALPTIGPLFAF